MVNRNANRLASLRRMIETAIEECRGAELAGVRNHLEDAATAVRRSESKMSADTPRKKWESSASATPPNRLTKVQAEDAISKIEDMIRKEEGKTKSEGPDELMNG